MYSALPLRPWIRLVHNNQDRGPKCGASIQEQKDEVTGIQVRLDGSETPYHFDLHQDAAKATFTYSSSQRSTLPTSLASSISEVFKAETIAHLLNINSLVTNGAYKDALSQYPADIVHEVEKQMQRAAKTSPRYHVTFSLFSATGEPSSWDIQKALGRHIQPLVHALRNTAEIEDGTQVQLFSPYSASIQSSKIDGIEGNFIKETDLTSFVNAAEWPLSPSVGDGPTLNFIVYVPSKSDRPLGVGNKLGGAWLVPQWGGIGIVNTDLVKVPDMDALHIPPHLTSDQLSDVFATFSSQLLALLGVPASDTFGLSLPLGLRLKAYQRISSLHLHLKAASSLASLARLAKHLNTIPIPRHVSQLVDDSLANLTASDAAMSAGDWDEAVKYASIAYVDSEKAFFDKSMVGQAYFPDEHKMAVYMPFLGPIAVPLVVTLLREVKRLLALIRGGKQR